MKKLKYWLKTSQKCGKATKLINIQQFQKTQKTSKISESQKRSKLNRISSLNLVVKDKLAERLKKLKVLCRRTYVSFDHRASRVVKRIKTNFSLQSNAKRDATKVEKSKCIEPCEREKQQVKSGEEYIERTRYYRYVTYHDGPIFEDCTDFCIDRSRFLAQIKHNEIDSY